MLGFLSTVVCGVLLTSVGRTAALPALQTRAVTQVTSTDLSALAPFTNFAGATYCSVDQLNAWSCKACKNISGFKPTLVGGDGNAIQQYFVGSWSDQKAVVVAHEGTDPTKFLSDLTDVNFVMKSLDTTLFPGVPSGVQVHGGFADEHAKTASIILAEVKSLLSSTGYTNVFLVGHSLGGALSELEAMYMTLNLPSSVHVKAVTYGTPRVGNPAWATFFDSKVADFKRINNEEDPIPIVPGRGLGFQHPHGEIHILGAGNAVSCPGDDDATDAQCTISSVPNIIKSNLVNHLGPYEGIYVGTIFC
ncbi:alpha/beta-hydrolase [Lentinus tigrinus ALCF2SS1-7]|uniref:Alpha/beta-hydrolase n=1 Tax=Lentinus tigrinus ALCF2SS1-6 TaxID=1328759 RepID=A0A5C2RX55_9APHY|nr:alpha/beta-hydrolase [Lentinus tigrinus ALCF2SS1-6]RPD72559.1 alpha/beta-hydrolase [Lentinus tigrinus ALCF2SS1-7]